MAPATCTSPAPATSPRSRAVAAVSSEAVAPATPSMPSTWKVNDSSAPSGCCASSPSGTPFRSASTGWSCSNRRRAAPRSCRAPAGAEGKSWSSSAAVEKLTDASATGVAGRRRRPKKSWTVCPGTMVLGSIGPLISRRIASGELSRTAPAAGSDERTVGPSPESPRSDAVIVS